MASREENSLFLSLKEVHNTLQDRLKEEEDEKQSALEMQRRAVEDEARRKREEEEAKVRAAEDAIRREREERERKEREDRIRVEETERRARIEAQARIEEAQIRAATEAIRNKPIPVRLIAAVSAVLIAFSIMVVIVVKRSQEAAKKDAMAKAIAQIDAERRHDRDEEARLQKALKARMAEAERLGEMFNAAKSEQERIRLKDQAADAASRAAHASAEAEAQRRAAKEREKKAKFERCKNADDPLCGI